jgi:hypothetical protein
MAFYARRVKDNDSELHPTLTCLSSLDTMHLYAYVSYMTDATDLRIRRPRIIYSTEALDRRNRGRVGRLTEPREFASVEDAKSAPFPDGCTFACIRPTMVTIFTRPLWAGNFRNRQRLRSARDPSLRLKNGRDRDDARQEQAFLSFLRKLVKTLSIGSFA